MILKALYDYYQAMAELKKDEVAQFGMDWVTISFVIIINEDGTFKDIELTKLEGLLPTDKTRTAAVVPYILWDKASYVLGLSDKEGGRVKQEFDSFRKEIQKIHKETPENIGFRAIHLFYEKEQYLEAQKNEALQKAKGGWIAFRLSTTSDPHQLIGSDEDARQYRIADESNRASVDACCMITGKRESIAKTHKGIKISRDNPPLISFQINAGYDSYGKEQGANAPISERASDAIAKGLNILLEWGRNTNYKIGDTTFVFWSTLQKDDLLSAYKEATFTGLPSDSDFDDEEEDEASSSSNESKEKLDPERNVRVLKRALEVVRGYQSSHIDKEHPDRFYILGLTPNKSRLSVKLWMEGTVREIVGNTLQHLEDMNIVRFNGLLDEEAPPLRPIYKIMQAIYTATDSTKWPRQVVQELLESIIKGLPYPPALQMACLERIHHDHTSKYPVTELRAALLKAYINRKHKKNPQITHLTMALDKSNSNPAYLAGRLFALLERIQEKAIPGVKANITDRYFRTASATPGIIFGRLLQLSAFHLSKIKKEHGGLGYYFDRQIQEVLELLPGGQATFDKFFTPDQQSIFAVGYYHQKAYRDQKAESAATEDEQETENQPN